jgi:hypothetical protein
MMFRNTTSLSRDRLSVRGLSRREGGLPLHIGRALVSAKKLWRNTRSNRESPRAEGIRAYTPCLGRPANTSCKSSLTEALKLFTVTLRLGGLQCAVR